MKEKPTKGVTYINPTAGETNKTWDSLEYISDYLTDNDIKYTEIPEKNINFSGNFEILTADSKEEILKKIRKFSKKHKITNISLSTNSKYSQMMECNYTEFNVLIQYI